MANPDRYTPTPQRFATEFLEQVEQGKDPFDHEAIEGDSPARFLVREFGRPWEIGIYVHLMLDKFGVVYKLQRDQRDLRNASLSGATEAGIDLEAASKVYPVLVKRLQASGISPIPRRRRH